MPFQVLFASSLHSNSKKLDFFRTNKLNERFLNYSTFDFTDISVLKASYRTVSNDMHFTLIVCDAFGQTNMVLKLITVGYRKVVRPLCLIIFSLVLSVLLVHTMVVISSVTFSIVFPVYTKGQSVWQGAKNKYYY